MEFTELYAARKDKFVASLEMASERLSFPRAPQVQKLRESMQYSLMGEGKRFRPVLGFMLSEAFGGGPNLIAPWVIAIEMIHTYSLIHDDLPALDNDNLRRGRPTNHKIFGEDVALLAGDALLTEAFRYLAEEYSIDPRKGLELIRLLGEAAGTQGMISGQMMDIVKGDGARSIQELNLMHALKTGALIRASVEGVAVILGLPEDRRQQCRRFGSMVGLAFQLKDDLLDSSAEIEKGSFPEALGLAETESYLHETTAEARQILDQMGLPAEDPLHQIMIYNQQREK